MNKTSLMNYSLLGTGSASLILALIWGRTYFFIALLLALIGLVMDRQNVSRSVAGKAGFWLSWSAIVFYPFIGLRGIAKESPSSSNSDIFLLGILLLISIGFGTWAGFFLKRKMKKKKAGFFLALLATTLFCGFSILGAGHGAVILPLILCIPGWVAQPQYFHPILFIMTVPVLLASALVFYPKRTQIQPET